ncbi:MAG: Rne/Rng family ribonuclease [Candidatus Krumholzibacteriota bacterium]|nr:Rne/Rng family ribonuclease [Candidatus Krumholzibacteriota bacterium]
MKKEIIINYTQREVRIAILEDRQLVEFLIEREDSRRSVGDIYYGRVNAVLPGIQAAFVDIGQEKAAFLHVSDVATDSLDPELLDELDIDSSGGRRRREYPPIESLLRKGQEIVVQVRKEAIGTKGPRVSSQLSLPGRYAVFMPNLDHIGVSKKIERRKERARLRSIVRRIRPRGGAVIVRTAGQGVEEEPLREDIRNLEKRWEEISARIAEATPPTVIHEDVDITVFALRDLLTDDINQIVIDRKEEFDRIRSYIGTFAPELLPRVKLHRGQAPIFDHYDVEDDIEKTLERKIWLRKGAYIVIEHTEALVTIDVNTGRFTGKKNQEETILEANLIAAREIARQLRLRDIGGIIVVDFIDMETEENKRKVYNEFRGALRKDRSRARVSPVSDLGLIEVSRKRVRPSLMHYYSDDCPYCSGSGKVLSIESMAMKMEHWIRRIGMSRKEKGIRLTVNPVLGIFLREERWENIEELAGRYRLDVEIIDDPRLHREDFEIRSIEGNRDLKRGFS